MALQVGELFATLNMATGGFDSGLKRASTAFKKFGLLAVDVLGSFMKDSIEAGMNFDTAMSQLAATMGKSVDELDELKAKALEMGSTTKFTASEAAEGLNILAQAGLNAQEQIAGIGTVLDLASAGAISMDTSATYLSATVKGFGDDMANSAKYADIMAKGATLANTSVNDLGAAMSGVAASANSYGQSVETTALALLRMAEQNITATEAATGLKRAMQVLYAPSSTAAKALKQLGVSAYDSKGNAKDFNVVIDELDTAMKALNNDAKKNALASDIFGARGLTVFNALVSSSEEKVASFTQGIAEAAGSAADQAATQLDNLAGDVTIFKSAVEGLQIAVTQSSTGMIRDAVQGATGVIDAFHKAFEEGLTAESLTGVFESMGAVLQNVGSQLGEMILNGMDALAGLVPSIVDNISAILKKAVKGITKLLPTVVKNVISAIPSLLGGLLDIVPDLTTALFDAAGSAVEGLITMLPDLIPKILTGVATIVPKIGEGVKKLIESAFKGLDSIALDLGLRGMSVDEVLDQKLGEFDSKRVKEISENIKATYTFHPVTINVEEFQTEFNNAYATIQEAINGLMVDEDTSDAIMSAILRGSGAEALTAALKALDVDPEKAEQIATNIETSFGFIEEALSGQDLETWQIDEIVETLKSGGNLQGLLESFGMEPETAAEVAGKITDSVNELGGALGNINLNADQLDQIQAVYDKGNAVQALLITFGLDPDTAEKVAQKIRETGGDIDTALEEFGNLGLNPDQLNSLESVVEKGGSVESLLIEFGLKPDTAKKVAKAIEDSGGDIDAALKKVGDLGLNPDQLNSLESVVEKGDSVESLLIGFGLKPDTAKKVAKAIEDSGGDVDKALKKVGDLGLNPDQLNALKDVAERGPAIETALVNFGLSPDSAKALREAIEACGGDVNAAIASLNIDLGPVVKYLLQSGSAAAMIAASLLALEVDETTVDKVIQGYDQISGTLGTKIIDSFNSLKKSLTDGIPDKDQPEFKEAKEKIHAFWEEAQSVVDEWEKQQIQNLKDSGLEGDELEAAIKNIKEQAQSARDELQSLSDETDTWVENNAGASAKVVEQHFDQLEQIVQKVLGVDALISQTTSKITAAGGTNRRAVQQGLLSDAQSQAEALNYTKQELEQRLKNVQDETARALEEAGEAYGDDLEKYAAEKERILSEQAQKEAEAYAKYDEEMRKIAQGMMESNPDVKAAIDAYNKDMESRNVGKALRDRIAKVVAEGNPEGLTLEDLMGELDIDDDELQQLADNLGQDIEDVKKQLSIALKGGSDTATQAFDILGLSQFADGGDQSLADYLLANVDFEEFNNVWQAGIESALVIKSPNIDWTDVDEIGKQALYDSGLHAGAGYSQGMAEADMSGGTDAMVDNAESALETSQASGSPAQVFVPYGEYAAQGYGEGMARASMSTYATTMVSNLKTAVQTAAAGAGLAEAGAAIAESLRQGMEGTDFSGLSGILSSALSGVGNGLSLSDQGATIGKSMTDGLAQGIKDGKSRVIQAASEVAKAAIKKAKDDLGIASPSRVFAEIGRMNDEGLAQGMTRNIRIVSKSAAEVAQASADAMTFRPQNGFGRIASLAQGYTNGQTALDYDRLADAVTARPAYFDVNGRRIAEATVTDNSEALTASNKRIMAGVGSV